MTRGAGVGRRGAALAACALAIGVPLGCQSILGIHDVARDEVGGAGGGAGAGGHPQGGGGGSGGQSQEGFSLSLGAAIPRVVRGSSRDLTVTVTREPGFDGPVEVTLNDLPSGVTATSVVVAPMDTSANLTVSATPPALLGDAPVTLRGAAGGLEDHLVPVTLLVADPPGKLDQTFDGDGIATSGSAAIARAIAVQDDDKIVVAGADGMTWMLARFLPDGAQDPDFGSGGVVTDATGVVEGLAIQPDGRILVVGVVNDKVAVVRFNPDGGRDQSFGSNGLAAVGPERFSSSHGQGVAVQSTGGIVVAGTESSDNNGFVLRFSPDGDLDQDFGSSSFFTASRLGYQGVVIGEGDRILVAGTQRGDSGQGFAVTRLDADGSPDLTFAQTGTIVLSESPYTVSGLALQSDGKPVLVGSVSDGVNGYALARFNSDGSPDATFNASGFLRAELEIQYTRGQAIAVQADGKLIGVTTSGTQASGLRASIFRRLPDSALDAGFGDGGEILFEDQPIANHLFAVAVQRDGRIVAAGSRSSAGFLVVRVWD